MITLPQVPGSADRRDWCGRRRTFRRPSPDRRGAGPDGTSSEPDGLAVISL